MNYLKHTYTCMLMILLMTACSLPEAKISYPFSYYLTSPAEMWEESFPLGNGRIGLMPDGGIDQENLVLNEISLWSGSKQDADNPYAYYVLGYIRKLLFEGRNDEAQEVMYNNFVCKGVGSGEAIGLGGKVPYGSYQILGNLKLNYQYTDQGTPASNYRRTLDLEQAIATTTFKRGDVNYTREVFTSFSNDVGVIFLTADVDKMINLTVGMSRPECYQVSLDGNDLMMQGQLSDGVDTVEMKGMRYASRVKILLPKGGELTTGDSTLTVKHASEVILLVGMSTNYFSETDEASMKSQIEAAAKKDYTALKREHTAAYRALFDRTSLDLATSNRALLPINERLAAYQDDPAGDPGLAALYFQFGRYLLISSTRVGLLPPNLQGLWCNTIQTPWNGDYHLNINLQMNLWPAEVCNLSELHLPLIEWTKQQVESGERTAKAYYNARGWVTHILGNVWQFTAPGEHPSWGATNTSAAWLCAHLYQHYLYTLDKEYLASVYPVMKGAALFFVDMLIEDPRSHYLVTAPTTSPENAYRLPNGHTASICAGSTMDNQILRELFSNTIEAARLLDCDADFAAELKEKQARLKPTTIGRDGRIMEWLEPFEEVEPHHRHVSLLYGLYPGDEITCEHTPKLAEAAKRSLIARGDESTGWSMAWKINFWARLHDGDHAHKLLGYLLHPCVDHQTHILKGGGTLPNLFCAHPPFQIDGNFGGCAGIAEMLVQSHTGLIEFIPALPTAWSKGSFRGLRVRGGGEVSAKWQDNKLIEAELKASVDHTYRIRLPKESLQMSIWINQKAVSLPVINGILEIPLHAGDHLQLTF